MRASLVVGVLLVIAGAVVAARGFSYTSHESVLKVGGLEATVEEKKTISPWIGVGGIVVGLVLILAGRRRGGAA
jgi:divalent metal cation (Fe/Co/Zn/Cd) transporter